MKSYYAIQVAIRYYNAPPAHCELWGNSSGISDTVASYEDGPPSKVSFDVRCWKEPPHVALANLRPDSKALLAFTRRYGVVSSSNDKGIRLVKLSDVVRFRDYLRRAWQGDEKVFDQMRVDEMVQLRQHREGAEIAITDLWTIIRTLFLRDRLAGRALICASTSPDCPLPYFLAERNGQKYCSHPCAVRENVRRFRKRQTTPKNRGRKSKPKILSQRA